MQEGLENQVVQLDQHSKDIQKAILNVVAKGIIKLSGNTFNEAITERNKHKAITEKDKNSGRNALLEALKRFDKAINKYYQDLNTELEEEVRNVRCEVHKNVRAILKPNKIIPDINDTREAKQITDQAREWLEANLNHTHLNWNDILQPDSPQEDPQPRTNPPIIPSRKGFFDITPKTADLIGMLGIGFIVSELAAAITVFYTSVLSPSTRDQAALWISNPTIRGVIMAVNIIAFAAAAFYKAIPEPSKCIETGL
jgi:hypothetical protein